ncbi:MAG TPA: inorganic diphosphatase [Polyangia bacterium]|nr:inorganic diphosphatase [Polyangia bacterium]
MAREASKVPVPTHLPPYLKDGGKPILHVVVETTRGGRNKMAYDEKLGVFRLKKVLPEGMSFPYDFGFVPSTRGGDGDPLDALVLMDESATTGGLVGCRLIGVILGEQCEKKGKKMRNDRLVAVAVPSYTHADLKHIDDLNRSLLKELEKFFVNYHAEYGETFRVLGCKGPKGAWRLVEAAAKTWRKERRRGQSG